MSQHKKILLFLFLLPSLAAFGQNKITFEYIQNWVRLCDTTAMTNEEEPVYVLEGVPYEKEALRERLGRLSVAEQYLSIEYLSSAFMDTSKIIFCRPPKPIVIILRHDNQLKVKEAKKELNRARLKFEDEYQFSSLHIMQDAQDPVLYINDAKVHHAEARKALAQLKAKNIRNISIVNVAPASLYGQNAKNGLVRVWLKD